MDNRPLTEVYSNSVNTCKQKGIKGSARTSYINKSLDASIAYKSYIGEALDPIRSLELLDKLIHDEEPKVRLLAYDALRAEEEQQKSNQQGKRRVLFVQDNYDDEIENSEFDFDV